MLSKNLPKVKSDSDAIRTLRYIGYLANLFLVGYVLLQMQSQSEEVVIANYKHLREYYFTVYIAGLIVLAFLNFAQKKELTQRLVPIIIVQLLLTTFAHAIAGLINDIVRSLNFT